MSYPVFSKHRIRSILNTLLALFVFASFSLSTQLKAQENKAQEKTCRLISSQEAAAQAKNKTGGKVVSIKLNKAGKNSVYRVRVLINEKRIKNLTIKACK